VSWSGSHCSAALLNSRSTGAAGVQLAMSASSQSAPMPLARAFSSIAGALSTPVIAACGKRLASSAVELPGPQPRSRTRSGAASGTRARRSAAGRVRWSSKAR
jgi:hypothetical protein